jgi:hypothetical protein
VGNLEYRELPIGTGLYHPDALDTADLCGFGPLSLSHVGFRVIMPNALTSISTSPGFGSGSGRFSITRLSAPPNCFMMITRIGIFRF